MISLQEKREALQQEIESIQQQLQSLQESFIDGISSSNRHPLPGYGGKAPGSASAEAAPRQKSAGNVKAARGKSRSTKRGALSEQILDALTASGKEGITLKDLAEQVGSKYQNVAIWFSTTGKKNLAIKKVVPGRYRLNS